MRDTGLRPAVPITPESVVRRTLRGGATVLVLENRAHPSVSIQGYLPAGARWDPVGQEGQALFTASMLTRGTERYSSQDLALVLDSLGASLGASADTEGAGWSARCLAEDVPRVLDLLTEVLLRPAFPTDEVEKQRVRIVTGIRESRLDTRTMADRTFREAAYPAAHPHHRRPEGEEATMAAVERGDLAAFHRRRYRPSDAVIAIVGDVQAQRTLDHLDAAFSEWTGVSEDTPAVPDAGPAAQVQRRTVAIPGKTQADIVLGAPGYNRTSPDYYAGTMANLILGRLGLMGRLGATVRDEEGLAYYVYSGAEPGFLAGPWAVRAGVNPANVDRAIAGILRELEGMQREPVRGSELSDARDYVTGSLAVRLETSGGIAQALLDIELFDLGLDYLFRFPALIAAVTPEAMSAAIARYLPLTGYTVATAVPA